MSFSFCLWSCVVFFFCGILMFGGISLVYCLKVRRMKNWRGGVCVCVLVGLGCGNENIVG